MEEHVDIHARTQPLKLIRFHKEKENSLYPMVFVITGYLSLVYHWNIITITQRVVFVLYKCLQL